MEQLDIFPVSDYIILECIGQNDSFINYRAFNKYEGSLVVLKYAIFNRSEPQFKNFLSYLELISSQVGDLFLPNLNIYYQSDSNEEDTVTLVLLMQNNVATLKQILDKRRSKYQSYTEPELVDILLKWVYGFQLNHNQDLLSKVSFNLNSYMVVPNNRPCDIENGIFDVQTNYSYKISNFDEFESPSNGLSPPEIIQGLSQMVLELMGLEADFSSEAFVNFPNLSSILKSMSSGEISLEELKDMLEGVNHFQPNEDLFWPIQIEIPDFSEIEKVKNFEDYSENYMSLGFYSSALDPALNNLEYHRVNNPNSLQFSKSLNDVGVVYWRIREFYKAKDLFLECESSLQKIYGKEESKNKIEMAICYNNLGLTYEELKDYDQAQKYLEMSYEIKIIQENLDTLPNIMNNIATFYEKTHLDDDKAKEYMLNALELKQNLGSKPNSLAISFNNIAVYFSNLGKLEEASQYMDALRLMEQQINITNENYIIYLNNQAYFVAQQGEIGDALKIYNSALTIINKQNRNKSLLCATILGNYSYLLFQMQDFLKASVILEKVIEIKTFLLGVYNISYAITANNLGETYLRLEKYDDAIVYLEKSLEIKSQFLDPNDKKMLISLNNLGLAYLKVKNFEKAKDVLSKALNIDPNSLASMNNWALMLSLSGEHQMAVDQFQKIIENLREMGENNEDIIKIMNNLSALYIKMKNYDESEECLRAVVQILEEKFPEKVDFINKTKDRLEKIGILKEKQLL